MAIDINATLIVQSFNILVAYVLLRKLLFKPAIQALRQEQQEREHLKSLVSQREDTLAQTEEKKQFAWQEFQALFSQSSPTIRQEQVLPPHVESVQQLVELTDNQVATLAQDVQRVILKKVKNVNE